MAMIGFRRDLLRPAHGEGSSRVTFTELFFDLVFVFAVTQVSHVLIHEESPLGILHTVILGAAIWWMWVDTAWVTNWLDPEKPLVRGMLVGLMLVGLLMSSAIPHAFGESALVFAIAFTVFQLGRSVFTILAFARHRPDHAVNFVRITVWLAASGALWVLGAVLPSAQLWLWIAALLLDYTGPRARFWLPGLGRSPLATWDVTGAHMAERVSLFIIIALGESLIVSGTSFSERGFDAASASAFASAFAGSVLLWLLYFSHGERAGSSYISSARERGLVAQVAYTYVPVPMVLGIVVSAVADHAVLADPDAVSAWGAGLVCAGFAVYLLGNALFRRATGGPWLLGHLAGVVALCALVAAYPMLPLVAIAWIADAVLLAVVVVDEFAVRRNGGALPRSDDEPKGSGSREAGPTEAGVGG
jgi:low temperature requirement protein LtrA